MADPATLAAVRQELADVTEQIVTFQAQRDRAMDACDLSGYWYAELNVDALKGRAAILKKRLLP